MNSAQIKTATIDEYISRSPEEVRQILQNIRMKIREAAPDAEEVISYQMPAFRQNGILVYFALFKNHIGFFPTSSGIEKFKNELRPYKFAKGSVQFPLDRPIPFSLIQKIVKYRVKENLSKIKSAKKK